MRGLLESLCRQYSAYCSRSLCVGLSKKLALSYGQWGLDLLFPVEARGAVRQRGIEAVKVVGRRDLHVSCGGVAHVPGANRRCRRYRLPRSGSMRGYHR